MGTQLAKKTVVPVHVDVPLSSPERASKVLDRVVTIAKNTLDNYVENGLLLREIYQNGYYKEWGYDSFNEAIEALNVQGKIDYGPRNARHFIKVVDMIDNLKIDAKDLAKLGISKLREIAGIKDEEQQRKLLSGAENMTTAEVEAKTRAIRNKTNSDDPLQPITLMATKSQREVFDRCVKAARRIWSLDDGIGDTTVLIDSLLADWELGLPVLETEAIEGEIAS